jgi:hypothetical protein
MQAKKPPGDLGHMRPLSHGVRLCRPCGVSLLENDFCRNKRSQVRIFNTPIRSLERQKISRPDLHAVTLVT